ncbi:MAG: hypothetical protein O7E57_13495 [Gammaproteobacteria bacterium]|nr:hypothetical protein [Gammaproteobacteria bacterium]MCZ6709195.1 hypothetical protein [Gammaproteobacteria bacterium]
MAQPYLDQLEKLVCSFAPASHDLICKHFFSGAALYVQQRICASLSPKGLAFKLGNSRCENILAHGKAVPLQYFDNAPIKRDYILLPDVQNLDDTDIIAYFEECVVYASSTTR